MKLEETAVEVADPEIGADDGKTEIMLPLKVVGATDTAVPVMVVGSTDTAVPVTVVGETDTMVPETGKDEGKIVPFTGNDEGKIVPLTGNDEKMVQLSMDAEAIAELSGRTEETAVALSTEAEA